MGYLDTKLIHVNDFQLLNLSYYNESGVEVFIRVIGSISGLVFLVDLKSGFVSILFVNHFWSQVKFTKSGKFRVIRSILNTSNRV